MAFYGLDRLDAKMAEHITADNGIFVELGAYDGITQNNTLHFEEKGWRGVLIEPVPAAFSACRRNRPLAKTFNCACVRPDFPSNHVEIVAVGLMSVIRGGIGGGEAEENWIRRGETVQQIRREMVHAPARTLDSVLIEAEIPRVDLLVLDVEGTELDVLAGFDDNRWQPRWIVCEDAFNRSVQDYLGRLGYSALAISERKYTRDVLYTKVGR